MILLAIVWSINVFFVLIFIFILYWNKLSSFTCFVDYQVFSTWASCSDILIVTSRDCLTLILVIIDISYLQCPFHPLPVESSCFSITSLNQRVVCVEHGPAVMFALGTYRLSYVPGNSVRIIVCSPLPRTLCSTLDCSSYEVASPADLSAVWALSYELVFHENVMLTNELQQLSVREVLSPPQRTPAWTRECHQTNDEKHQNCQYLKVPKLVVLSKILMPFEYLGTNLMSTCHSSI